jgi:hypothetical protein
VISGGYGAGENQSAVFASWLKVSMTVNLERSSAVIRLIGQLPMRIQ